MANASHVAVAQRLVANSCIDLMLIEGRDEEV